VTRQHRSFRESGNAVDFSHGVVATASSDHTISLWNFHTREQIVNFPAAAINSINFSKDGKKLAYGGAQDCTISVYDLEKQKVSNSWKGSTKTINSVLFHEKGNLYSAGKDNLIKCWNPNSMQLIRTLEGHKDAVNHLAISAKGLIASAGLDKKIIIWRESSGEKMQELEGHKDSVNCVAFSNDGNFLVSGSTDTTIKIWSMDSFKLLNTIAAHSKVITSVTFAGNDKYIFSGSHDKTSKLWTKGGDMVSMFPLASICCAVMQTFVDDKKESIIGADYTGTTYVWKIE